MRATSAFGFLFILAIGNPCATLAQDDAPPRASNVVIPLARAHAHNDYEHTRPLFDALDHGFCSIEPDIWLMDGRLLVAHDRSAVKPERTLQTLYLDPLRARVKANGARVYPNGPSVMLLIDIKSDAEQTYMTLSKVLRDYAAILTEFTADKTITNAVTVVISGNRPRETMKNEAVRYAAYDGRLVDLGTSESVHFIPLISDDWQAHFKWLGIGPMPEAEREKLRGIVARCHAASRKVRFWATPDTPEVWKELFDAGVDLINADDLGGLQKFLLNQNAK